MAPCPVRNTKDEHCTPPHLTTQLVQASDGANDRAFLHQSDLRGRQERDSGKSPSDSRKVTHGRDVFRGKQ